MTDESKENVRRQALKRTFRELTGLIRTNFTDAKEYGGISEAHNQKFITLTYRENMTDESRLYTDFKKFMMRFEYAYPNEYEFISVAEPQGRGAWHVHLMLIASNIDSFWVDKERLTKIWGHGATTITELKSNDVGAYYAVYFTSIFSKKNQLSAKETSGDEEDYVTGEEALQFEKEVEEGVEAYAKMRGITMSAKQKELKKKHIKGLRLDMYPKNMRFYRCSRGVKRPEKYKGALISHDEYELIYERGFVIKSIAKEKEVTFVGEVINEEVKDSKVLNDIYHATYRKKT
jgi:hypothetical protein